jgi:RNA polymerase sigma-70 factor (ECF subfamily)
MDRDVDQIVARVRAGRTDSYAEIVARYQDEVWRIVVHLLADRDASSDLVQQVFIDAYFHLDQYRPGTDFGAWLRSIARNRLRREARSAARATRRLEAYRRMLLERLDDSPRAERQEQALHEALRECREKLSDQAARVLDLRYTRGLDFEAIAAEVQSTAAGVQRMISRIRLQLRDCIKAKVATT